MYRYTSDLERDVLLRVRRIRFYLFQLLMDFGGVKAVIRSEAARFNLRECEMLHVQNQFLLR